MVRINSHRKKLMCMLWMSLFVHTILGQDIAYLTDLLNRVNYDKRVRPTQTDGNSLKVETQLTIEAFGPIDEKKNTFQVVYYLRHWWFDNRLNDSQKTPPKMVNTHEVPALYFWEPTLFVTNAREIHHFTDATRLSFVSTGKIYTSRRYKATCTCPMNLRYYPFDIQECHIIFESYAYTNKDISLFWNDNPVFIDEGNEVDGYSVESVHAEKRVIENKVGNVQENYDNLIVVIKAKRSLMYFVYRTYIPTILLMVFNIASYWIPVSSTPARVTLIITTLLSSTFILQSVSEQTTKTKYTTPMQMFLMVNVATITISIIEFVVVLVLERKEQKIFFCQPLKPNTGYTTQNGIRNFAYTGSTSRRNQADQNSNAPQNQNGVNVTQHENGLNVLKDERESRNIFKRDIKSIKKFSHLIDVTFRVTIPLGYFLFCCIYFAYYLYMI